jgi:hypothetical protein
MDAVLGAFRMSTDQFAQDVLGSLPGGVGVLDAHWRTPMKECTASEPERSLRTTDGSGIGPPPRQIRWMPWLKRI